MADQKQEYKLILSTVDQASAQLLALRKQIESMSDPMAKVNKEFDKASQKLGEMQKRSAGLEKALNKGMPWINTRMALPTMAIGGLAIKQSADFEASTNRVKVLAGYAEDFNETARKAMADTQKMARDIAQGLPFGPTQVMDAFGVILGMDPNVDKAKQQIKPVLNLALSDQVSPEFAAKLMQTFQAAFDGVSYVQSSNMMAKLVAASSVRLLDLQDTFRNVAGSTITKKNATPEDILAATGVLSKSALVGPEAGTKIAVFLRELSMLPIDEGKRQALKAMGLSPRSFFDKEGNLLGMQTLLEKLYKVRNNPLLAKVTDKDNLTAVQFLLSKLPEFRALKKELEEQKTKTMEAGSAFLQAKAQTEGFKGSINALQGSLEELALKMGDAGLLKAATDLVKSLQVLVDMLGKSDPMVIKLGFAVGALTLGVAALGNTLQGLLAFRAFAPMAFAGLRTSLFGVAAAATAAETAIAATAATAAATTGAAVPAAATAAGGAGLLGGIGLGPAALGALAVGGTTYGLSKLADNRAQNWAKSNFSLPGNRMLISDIVKLQRYKQEQAKLEVLGISDEQMKKKEADRLEELRKKEAERIANHATGLRNLERQVKWRSELNQTLDPNSTAPGNEPDQQLGKITININGLPQGSTVDMEQGKKIKYDLNLGTIMQSSRP